jgi:DNA polymerase V
MTDKLETLESYLSNYAAGAARKLRDEHWACHTITVFIATNPHRNDLPQYSNGASFKRPSPTADTAEITKIAIALLHKIYRDRYQYKRAGITLSDITNNQAIQLDLFTDEKTDLEKRKKVMQVTDSINQRYGMDKIRMAVQGYNTAKLNMEGFQPLRNQTTDIDDIITIGK